MSLRVGNTNCSALQSTAATACVLTFWQAGCHYGIINSTFLPSPLIIAETLVDEIITGQLLTHFQASIKRLIIGGGAGTLLGLLIGLSIHLSSITRSILSPWVSSLFAVPKIALLPLFILWLGTGETSRIAIITLGVGLPTAIYTWRSLDQVEQKWLELGRSLQLSQSLIIRNILFPAALPNILTGIRLSTTLGIILLTAAEMLGASSGIGYYLMNAGNLALVEHMMAGIVALMLLAAGFNLLLTLITNHLLKWMN